VIEMSTDEQAAAERYEAYLWDRRSQLIMRVRLSILYHLKRERFFDLWDKTASIATTLAASAAVAVLLKRAGDAPEAWAAGLTAALSLIPLVVNPAEKARKHGLLAGEFRRLLSECDGAGERWSEAQCDRFTARLLELEAPEPAPLNVLVIDCQNQLNVASGRPQDRVPLRFYEKWFKQWVDFDASKIVARAKRDPSPNH
jgi:hypothetical protein